MEKSTVLTFQLSGKPYIQLNQLLKLLGLVESGGEANTRITNSEVIVNGSIDSRKRRKLVVGDKVKMDEYSVKIV